MFSFTIDGQAESIQMDNTGTLAGLLEGINSTLAKDGRFIASLKVDGKEMEGCSPGVDRSLDSIESIEITSESPVRLAARIIGEAQNYIDGLIDFLKGVAGHYSAGSDCAGAAFVEAVQGLQWFVQMTDFIETNLRLDFTSISVNGRSISESVNALNGVLQDLAVAQEASDPVMLADILEYDLVPCLAEWKNIYTVFERSLAAQV